MVKTCPLPVPLLSVEVSGARLALARSSWPTQASPFAHVALTQWSVVS